MACDGCIQKLMAKDEVQTQINNEALKLAKEINQWVAVYIDDNGEYKYIDARYAPGRIARYISPSMQNFAI